MPLFSKIRFNFEGIRIESRLGIWGWFIEPVFDARDIVLQFLVSSSLAIFKLS